MQPHQVSTKQFELLSTSDHTYMVLRPLPECSSNLPMYPCGDHSGMPDLSSLKKASNDYCTGLIK